MERVIVSVKRHSELQFRDMEVSADMPIRQLMGVITRALGWDLDANGMPIQYQVQVRPSGRMMEENETLAQVGAWDGSWLVFYAGGAGSPQASVQGVVQNWHTIDMPTGAKQNTPSAPASDVKWKQLD